MKGFSIRIACTCLLACLLALLHLTGTPGGILAQVCFAQTATPAASPQPKPASPQEEPIKVYTEEVLIPVLATDSDGRVDPTLELDDLLVLEDGVPQVIRSVRRIPANVLLLLDTAGAENPVMKTNATRNLAIRLVSELRSGDRLAAIQFGGRVELIQSWTTEPGALIQSLKAKLSSGSRTRLTGGLAAAVAELKDAPVGNRHVVLFSDGNASPTEDAILAGMVAKLLATQATVHVISYTLLGRRTIDELHPKYGFKIAREKRKTAVDTANELTRPNDPETLGSKLYRKLELTIESDWRMWARGRKYAKALKKNEQWLAWLAEESGGSMMLPNSTEELPKLTDELAREIDSQYLVTYRPKLRFIPKPAAQIRHIEVVSRRVGLQLRSRRSYLVPAPQ